MAACGGILPFCPSLPVFSGPLCARFAGNVFADLMNRMQGYHDGKSASTGPATCPLCGRAMSKADVGSGKTAICPDCVALLARAVHEQPELLRELWATQHGQPPAAPPGNAVSEPELPEVLDARRYRTIDRDGNK